MSRRPYPETPNLDRMIRAKDRSQAIGDFIEWMAEEKGIHLGMHRHHEEIERRFAQDRIEDEMEEEGLSPAERITRRFAEDREARISIHLLRGELDEDCYGMDPDCPSRKNALHQRSPRMVRASIDVERLLMDHFGVDGEEMERERAAALAWIREQNEAEGA